MFSATKNKLFCLVKDDKLVKSQIPMAKKKAPPSI